MQVIVLDPKTASYEQIAATVGNSINTPAFVQVGHKKLIVERKCTYQSGCVKTKYVHIKSVVDFENKRVIAHYRETKAGTFAQL